LKKNRNSFSGSGSILSKILQQPHLFDRRRVFNEPLPRAASKLLKKEGLFVFKQTNGKRENGSRERKKSKKGPFYVLKENATLTVSCHWRISPSCR
jgi:hypothetical protein